MATTEEIKVRASADVQGMVNGMRQINTELAKTGAATAKAGKDFTGFSRVIQDLPFGFTAISNNLTQLVPAAGAAGLAFSALVAGLTFAQTGLSNWTRGLNLSSKGVDVLKESIQEASKAVGEDIVKLEVYRNKLNDVNIPAEQRVKIIKEYNKVADEANKIDEKQVGNLDLINSKIEAQNSLIIKRALSVAAMGKITEKVNSLIEDEIRLQEQLSAKGFSDLGDFEAKTAAANKKRAEELAKSLEKIKKPANELSDPLKTVHQGLDGIATPANTAALAVRNSEDALFSLVATVKKGREGLQKFIGDMGGLLTVDGLTTQSTGKVTKKLKEQVDNIRAEFTSFVGRDNPVGELFFRVKLAQAKVVNNPSDTIGQQLTKELLPKEIPVRANIALTPNKLSIDEEEFIKMVEQGTDALNAALQSGIVGSISAFAEGLGDALAGGGLEQAFKGTAEAIGGFLQQIGKMMVSAAIKAKIFKEVFTKWIIANPALAIAAGAGLIIAGSALKNFAAPKIKGFATGGVIPSGYPNDSYLARLTSGERVLTPAQNKEWERGRFGASVMQTVAVTGNLTWDGQNIRAAIAQSTRKGGLFI